jgi:lipopolysaccharide export system protein LptC
MTAARSPFDRLIAWSPALLLGALAALTWWLDAQIQPPTPRLDGASRHDPDLFVEDFRAVTFDADGRIRQSLAGRRAEHFPDDNTIAFTAPSVALTTPGEPTVTLTADAGTLSGDRERITFSGNVRAQRAAVPGGAKGTAAGPVTLTTELLRVTPKTGRAETDRAVTIEEPRGIIRGVGMDLDNQARTVKLRSQVRGTMNPDRVPQ